MRRKSIHKLGETELEVLNIVWELGEASVAETRDRILKHRAVAYTTIMTVMKNLADKGYLAYEQRGNSYVYYARKSAGDVRRTIVRDVIRNVFMDSPLALVQTLVEDENLSHEDLHEIRAAIQSMDLEEKRND